MVLGFNSWEDVLDPGGSRRLFDTAKADTSSLTGATTTAADEEQNLANERAGITPDKTQQLATRTQQQAQLPSLQQAAAGAVPSAAQIQGGQAAGQDFARNFALASALKARNPGAALTGASQGLVASGGQIANQAANQRAAEIAGARGLLSKATTGIRQGDLGAYGIDQASRDANLAAIIQQQKLQAQNAEDIAAANAQAAGFTNQKRASILQGGGSLGASLLSDKQTKRGMRDRSLADALGKQVHGVVFEYKPEHGDPDQHFGVIAQDVEKVLPGVVRDRPDGLKEIMTPHLTTANTAMIAELAKRIRELEGRG